MFFFSSNVPFHGQLLHVTAHRPELKIDKVPVPSGGQRQHGQRAGLGLLSAKVS